MNFGGLKESFVCSVHADATAFTYLTLLVPVAQFLDIGLALVYTVYIKVHINF